MATDEERLTRGRGEARIGLALYECVEFADELVEAVRRYLIEAIEDV